MAELILYKARISMACSSISGLEDKVRKIDKAFEFPCTATECNAFIVEKMAEIDELQISLTGLLENLEAQVQIAMNFLGAKKDQSDKDKLMNDLAAFLSTEANSLQIEGISWTSRLKYRMRELEKQSNLIRTHTLTTSSRYSPMRDQDTESCSSTRQSSENKVRLPQLEVPTFDGSYKDYPTFWTIFNSLIHGNSELSNVDKFLFLRQALKGTAASLLGNVPVIGKNYDKAIQLLDKRFNKSGCIADLLITELERLPRAEEDAHSCREALTSVTEKLTHIECAGVPLDNNRMWRRLILSKFPNSLNEKVLHKEQNEGKSFTTEEILDVLENAVALKETLALTTSAFEECDISGRSNFAQEVDEGLNCEENLFTQNSKHEQGSTSPRDSSAQCICGSYQHDATRCTTFQTAAERRDEARKQRLCFKCLQTDHRISDCTSLQSCYKCQGDHHTAVCMSSYSAAKGIPNTRSQQRTACNQYPKGQEFVQNSEVLHNESNAKRGGMQHVLMTATALAYDYTSTSYKPVTVFFDGGAQKSFINTRKSKALSLPVLQETTFKIGGFGGSTAHFTSNEVPLKLRTTMSAGVAVKAVKIHTKSTLTSTMSTAWLSAQDRRFIRKRKIRIAQPYLKTRQITPDILIGQDLIDQLILRDQPCTILPSGLILTPTVSGHAISGSSPINRFKLEEYSQNTVTIANYNLPLSQGNSVKQKRAKSVEQTEHATSKRRANELDCSMTRTLAQPEKFSTKHMSCQHSLSCGRQFDRKRRKPKIRGQPVRKDTDAQQECFASSRAWPRRPTTARWPTTVRFSDEDNKPVVKIIDVCNLVNAVML